VTWPTPYGQFLRAQLAKLEAEEADRRAWVNSVAAKHGVVRLAESLTAEELRLQQARVDYALGRKFLTTTPLPGLAFDGRSWYRTDPA
jgi:hypothetical protein